MRRLELHLNSLVIAALAVSLQAEEAADRSMTQEGVKPDKAEFRVVNDAPYQVIPKLALLESQGESLDELGFDSPDALFSGIDPASPVHCIAFSPDGSLLASGSADNIVKLWNLKS